jgi:hypothetical protein
MRPLNTSSTIEFCISKFTVLLLMNETVLHFNVIRVGGSCERLSGREEFLAIAHIFRSWPTAINVAQLTSTGRCLF